VPVRGFLKINAMAYAIFIFLVLCEVTWDWYHMEKLNKSPNYGGSNLLRVLLGGIYWACLPLMTKELSPAQWWFSPVAIFFNFWFLFNWWLNLARTWSGNYKPYWYLGQKSKYDKWQIEHGGAFAWFYIRMSLALISLIILWWII